MKREMEKKYKGKQLECGTLIESRLQARPMSSLRRHVVATPGRLADGTPKFMPK